MSALDAARNTPRRGDGPIPEVVSLPVKGSTHIYQGALVAIDTDGYAVPAGATATLRIVGRAAEDVNNTGSSGAVNVHVEQGIFRWENSSDADEITLAERGDVCYADDDQTVAKTDDTAQRPVAGFVVDVDDSGVWVESRLGIPQAPLLVESSINSRVSAEESTRTSQATSLTTRVSTEEATRASADTSLTTRVSAEESTRTSQATSLTTRVSNAESVETSTTNSLTTRVSSSTASLDARISSLIASIDA